MKVLATDVLIVGGGSAGIAAAVAASQSGCRVSLIERNQFLGGKATAAEVGTVCGLYKFTKSEKSEYVVNGFTKTFADELKVLSNTIPLHNNVGLHYLPYDIESYKNLALQMVTKADVQLFFNSEITAVERNKDEINCVEFMHRKKIKKIKFKAIIDCSGNACINKLANLQTIESKTYQAAAQIFTFQNVEVLSEVVLGMILIKEIRKAILNNALAEHYERVSIVQGSAKNNCVSLKLSIPLEVSGDKNNLINLRKKALQMVEAFSKYLIQNVSNFKHSSIKNIAPEVGIRVGVRPMGKYILTEENILCCRKFTNAIAIGSWPIEEWAQERGVRMTYFKLDDFYQIPATCLVSNSISNLFFGGRNISATDKAIASARVMGTCLQTGFAAGKLAASKIFNITETEAIAEIQKLQLNINS